MDVVGIGALNLDYLAGDVEMPGLDHGTERGVDAATIEGFRTAEVALGGSAFTTITTMARARTGSRLGFVGVAGRVPGSGPSALDELDAYGVDRRFVLRDERLCGVCVSIMRDGERTLLTHPGANVGLADHLDARFDEIVSYLARARLIHLTSFLDERTPGRLLDVLTAVKTADPRTLLSFDPGHVWCAERTDAVDGLLRLSDFLLVNRRERDELAGRPTGRAVVIVKHPSGTEVDGAFLPAEELAATEIADATGAGDVFAAGLLLELARDRRRLVAGCELGMRLARRRLRGRRLFSRSA